MKNVSDFGGFKEFSVALTESQNNLLSSHLDKGPDQEDLTFAYWRPSRGKVRFTAIISEIVLPRDGDRELHGNVSFRSQYARRALDHVPKGVGMSLLHSHLEPGWQGMSKGDTTAERVRLAGAVAGRTSLPLLGITRGSD